MANAGLTVFVVFFGISLLDAFWGGHWLRAAFWVAMGTAFWGLARMRRGRGGKAEPPGDGS